MLAFDITAITPEHALSILRTLINDDEKIAIRIKQIITKLICDVDYAETAGEVLAVLDSIEVEDFWDRSGSTREGYIEPYEMADEMIEEALSSFLDQLKEYKALSMENESKLFFMGILRGLYLFDKESNTQFREWAEDVSSSVFESLLIEWKKECKNREHLNDMKYFIKENCAEWFQPSFFE